MEGIPTLLMFFLEMEKGGAVVERPRRGKFNG